VIAGCLDVAVKITVVTFLSMGLRLPPHDQGARDFLLIYYQRETVTP
jgi:hypothetical protein